jgi:hypothetical protein
MEFDVRLALNGVNGLGVPVRRLNFLENYFAPAAKSYF